MPHHLRNNEDGPGNFREGIVLDKDCRKEGHSLVGVGTRKDVIAAKTITPGVRVTVKLARSLEDDALDDKKNIKGKIKAIDLLLFRKFVRHCKIVHRQIFEKAENLVLYLEEPL